MSEFTCSQGHLVAPSERWCRICGGNIVRMDGMTAKELEARDRIYEESEYKKEEEE